MKIKKYIYYSSQLLMITGSIFMRNHNQQHPSMQKILLMKMQQKQRQQVDQKAEVVAIAIEKEAVMMSYSNNQKNLQELSCLLCSQCSCLDNLEMKSLRLYLVKKHCLKNNSSFTSNLLAIMQAEEVKKLAEKLTAITSKQIIENMMLLACVTLFLNQSIAIRGIKFYYLLLMQKTIKLKLFVEVKYKANQKWSIENSIVAAVMKEFHISLSADIAYKFMKQLNFVVRMALIYFSSKKTAIYWYLQLLQQLLKQQSSWLNQKRLSFILRFLEVEIEAIISCVLCILSANAIFLLSSSVQFIRKELLYIP